MFDRNDSPEIITANVPCEAWLGSVDAPLLEVIMGTEYYWACLCGTR